VALSISSAVLLVVGKIVGALNYIDALAASGIRWIGRQIRDGAFYVGRNVRDAVLYVATLVSGGAAWIRRKTGEVGRATGNAVFAGSSFVATKVGASAQATGRGVTSGLSFAGNKTAALARSTGKALSTGSSTAAVKSAALARSSAQTLSAGSSFVASNSAVLARSTGNAVSKGASFAVTNAAVFARESGRLASAGFSWTSAKIHETAPPVARFLSICFSGISARATDLSRATGRGLAAGGTVVAAKTAALAMSASIALAPAFAWARAKAYAIAPSLAESVGKAGSVVRDSVRGGAGRIRTLFASTARPQSSLIEGAPAEAVEGDPIPVSQAALFAPRTPAGEKALSLPRHIGGFELSQMLIVAGTLLLVLGGLLLGGGLILRAGTPSEVAPPATSSDSLVWFFDQKDRPLAERSIFIFTGTPEGVRITGFSISGENNSDQPLTGLAGVLKPDVEGPEMPLSVSIDMPKGEATLHPAEASAAEAGEGMVPAHSVFRLIFPFPEETGAEQQGVTPEEVVQTFGGLMLKVHYDVAGKRKAFMHYLSLAALKDQLSEIEAGAKGS
jgi:hypothetical protein